MKIATFSFFFLCCSSFSAASRILFLFPSPSKSHLIVVKGLSTFLAEQGHDVTVVSPFPLEKPMKNYRDIDVEVPDDMTKFSSEMVSDPNKKKFSLITRLMENCFVMGNGMLNKPEFRKLMDEEKFDLVIIGTFFNNYLLGIGEHFKCPTILLSVSGAKAYSHLMVGNPLAVASVGHMIFGTNVDTFAGRVKTFLVYGIDFLMRAYYDYEQKKNYNLNFPSDRYVSYDDANRNVSLILVNSHFSQSGVRPFVPALVEVGGLQVKPQPDKLPERLQTWLDESKTGVILFSLGSNSKTKFLPQEKIKILLSVFAKLDQRVIMKWESDELEGKPENVLISKWVPQDDVLAHKKLKLFISHCGLGSVAESMFHGVPIVGMPVGADQMTNAEKVIAEGWGEKVDLSNLSEKELFSTIQKVLYEKKYAATVTKLSELYRDRPMNARETAKFWVEYVIRHRGAPHLRYPAADLNFWQRTSVDVVAFLLAIIYVVCKLITKAFKCLMAKIFKSTKNGKKKLKKN